MDLLDGAETVCWMTIQQGIQQSNKSIQQIHPTIYPTNSINYAALQTLNQTISQMKPISYVKTFLNVYIVTCLLTFLAVGVVTLIDKTGEANRGFNRSGLAPVILLGSLLGFVRFVRSGTRGTFLFNDKED
ncbi:MAG: hypothetical protein LH702_31605 [Phormidesmis sp. CAN_BIN44]|nr:hypothetical protein [Phormidesmis sp. CAN_BIN44]